APGLPAGQEHVDPLGGPARVEPEQATQERTVAELERELALVGAQPQRLGTGRRQSPAVDDEGRPAQLRPCPAPRVNRGAAVVNFVLCWRRLGLALRFRVGGLTFGVLQVPCLRFRLRPALRFGVGLAAFGFLPVLCLWRRLLLGWRFGRFLLRARPVAEG